METRNIKTAVAVYKGENPEMVKIVAAGKGNLASNLIESAIESDIPLYENPELLSQLAKFDYSGDVSPELEPAISEILSFIGSMDALRSTMIHGKEF